MHEIAKEALTARFMRIDGQVRGVLRMIDEDRSCIEVLTRCAAVRAALRRAELEILRDQFGHSVAAAFASGDILGERRKVEELVETIGRLTR
jgi:CsoR family transcriptional regulator, copper-sensing transcriptional repressor